MSKTVHFWVVRRWKRRSKTQCSELKLKTSKMAAKSSSSRMSFTSKEYSDNRLHHDSVREISHGSIINLKVTPQLTWTAAKCSHCFFIYYYFQSDSFIDLLLKYKSFTLPLIFERFSHQDLVDLKWPFNRGINQICPWNHTKINSFSKVRKGGIVKSSAQSHTEPNIARNQLKHEIELH